MIASWLNIDITPHDERKRLYTLAERTGGRTTVKDSLIGVVRSHYDNPRTIADDIKCLGFAQAATILREKLPRTPRARSGELGEILAAEFLEHQTDFRIPVRRLRYKDGRDMSLRGDDFLGIRDSDGELNYLKGEAKSGENLRLSTITRAREQLCTNNGRPTTISLLFVTDRLLEGDELDRRLGRRIRNAIGRGTIQSQQITHGLFILTKNDRQAELLDDLVNAHEDYDHVSVNLKIHDHQDFISWIYERAENLGND